MLGFIVKYFLLLQLLTLPVVSFAQSDIRIVGSKIVNYYLSFIVEDYTKLKHKLSPIIEASGSGTGINLLCLKQADIAASSRKITESEQKKCQKNGVEKLGSLIIGRDAVVIATSNSSSIKNISLKNLTKILAYQTVMNSSFTENIYHNWRQIDKNYPDQDIEIYGPYISSGSRHVLVEKIAKKYCLNDKFYVKKFADKDERSKYCNAIRSDGKYIEIGDNQNLLISKLLNNVNSLAILNYGYAISYKDKIDFVSIDGIYPDSETIRQDIYPFSRNLYIYYDKKNFADNPDKETFLNYLKNTEILTKNGYLEKKGLIYHRRKLSDN